MRRILLLLSLAALAAGFQACAADAPVPTPPGGNGNTNNALLVRVFTNNANPTAGLCSTIQAIVTLNGGNVPDGTGVIFSTDFGVFEQNSLPLVAVVTSNGSALTAICSTSVGVAKVKAAVTLGGGTSSGTIGISFQPSAQAIPFFAFCSPSNGANSGGTQLTINGGRFFGDATTTRVTFTAFGVTREGVVQSVTGSVVTVMTPAFPEATSPSVPVDIAAIFGTNTSSPITLAAPNCFVYGTQAGNQPKITAVLPSTGSNDGGTRITILGSGFIAPLQVFFGSVESPPAISITYNQIVVLAPPVTQQNRNATVAIRVHNAVSGLEDSLNAAFTYVSPLQLFGFSNNVQRVDGAFSPVQLTGSGFASPVAVTLAGFGATIISVSSTELVVLPGLPLVTGCADVAGPIQITNLNNGDSVSGGSFTYLVAETAPAIDSVFPSQGPVGTAVTILGLNLPAPPANASVQFGARTAGVFGASSGSLSVTAPDDFISTPPACQGGHPPGFPTVVETVDVKVTNRSTKCTVTATGAFSYTVPCQ